MKRTLSVLLAIILLIGAAVIPAGAVDTDSARDDAALAETGAEPTFDYEVEAGDDLNTLKAYLEMDFNLKINIVSDMEARIGEKKDRNSPYVEYWCTLGKGVKVINLNGHDLTLANDRTEQSKAMTMFRVPSGAELVINDNKNSGEITYDGLLASIGKTSDWNTTWNSHQNKHHLIAVTGGKLVVNSGKLIAGRSNKFYASSPATHFYRQINGCAITMTGGETEIRGGRFEGRGILDFTDYYHDSKGRAAAVNATGGKLAIYDGTFWGMGCADVLQISDGVDIKIFGGIYDTHKQDCKLADGTWTDQIVGTIEDVGADGYSTSYGCIGIPARATANNGKHTQVYVSGSGFWTPEQLLSAEPLLETSRAVSISPVEEQTGLGVTWGDNDSWQGIYQPLKLNWDKVTPLRIGMQHDYYYPWVNLRSFDAVERYDYDELSACFCNSEGGSNVAVMDAGDGSFWVDLNEMSKAEKDKLGVGNTYHLCLIDTEYWKNSNSSYLVRYRNNMTIEVTITEPDMTAPELNVGFTWENIPGGDGNTIDLTPTGDGTEKALGALLRSGRISAYDAWFNYYKTNGVWTTNAFARNTTGVLSPTDMRPGINSVRYYVRLYKGGEILGNYYADANIVYFPNITANKPIDSFNRILIDAGASSKTVKLGVDSTMTSGMFWVKDDVKISGATGANYTADLADPSKIGYYTVGFTVDGKDYYSPCTVYLGVKGGTRSISLSRSAATTTIKTDSDATPSFTVSTSGSGWGTIKQYKWRLVEYPADYQINARVRSDTSTLTKNRTLGWLQSHEGYSTEFCEGDYAVTCTAYDNYGNSATSAPVTVTIKRPPTGMEIWTEDKVDYHNITDSFAVVRCEETIDLDAVFTPQNSARPDSDDITFSSSDTSVCKEEVDYDIYEARKPGTATITAKYGTLTAKTKILVPKEEYSLTVPDAWLDAKAGGTIYSGALSVPSSEDFTAELFWRDQYGNKVTDTVFEGNRTYTPCVKIYPKKGVCYPVDREDYDSGAYTVVPERFTITVNGENYYNSVDCNKSYFYGEPTSSGAADDYLELRMDSTGKLIDYRDEYLSHVVFNLDVPAAGQPRDLTEDETTMLNCSIVTDGVINGGDSVRRVTDLSSIKDKDVSNDQTEDFTTYEAGEWYRYKVYLRCDGKYTTPMGGKVYFADSVEAVEPELGCISDDSNAKYNLLTAYVYFTPSDDISGVISGTVKSFITGAEEVSIVLIPEGEEPKCSTTVYGLDATYTLSGVLPGEYTLRVSKKNHVTRDYAVTVSGDTTQDIKICPIGDADNNGKVNSADAKAAFRHSNDEKPITDEYKLQCADVAKPNDRVNSADAKAIFQHANEQKSLWTE